MQAAPYLDPYGLISPSQDHGFSGNGLTYSSLWLIDAAHKSDIGSFLERDEVKALLGSIRRCQVKRGLYKRNPDHRDCQGWDDPLALIVMFYLLELWVNALEIFTYLEANRWCYNNNEPGKWRLSSFLGRYPQFVSTAYRCISEVPPMYVRVLHCVMIFISTHGRKSNQDNWNHGWLQLIAYAKKPTSKWETYFFKKWYRKFLSHFPLGLGQNLISYFGWDHPLGVNWIEPECLRKFYRSN